MINREMSPEAERALFQVWQRELLIELEKVGDPGMVSWSTPMIDAMVPFRLGMTPRATAQALIGHNSSTLTRIITAHMDDPACQAYLHQKQHQKTLSGGILILEDFEICRWEDDGGRVHDN